MKKVVFSVLLAGAVTGSNAQPTDAQQILSKMERRYFIENKGQWHSDVLYLCRMGGLDAWITKYGVNYTFYKIEKAPNAGTERASHLPKGKFDHEELENTILLGHRVLLKLQNHNPAPQCEGRKKQQGYYNYLIGNDPGKHATYVGLYKEAVVKDVYPGIDIRYYFDKGSLRYDYVVHPGADPSKIAFTLEGQNDAYIKNGNLYFTTRFGEVAMAELHTYQGKNTVTSRFEKQGNTWKIAVGNYDKTQTLVIDPLIYSTFIGGSAFDVPDDIAVDNSGNVYISGFTNSANYDVTPGVFQTSFGGGTGDGDAFVTKLNSTGTNLIYSTYIGGSSDDRARAIEIDANGHAYITGYTNSTNYPITAGSFQTVYGGGIRDVVVSKLNTGGTGFVFSTYLGGTAGDDGFDLDIDATGNTYVTGLTASSNYDITTGSFQFSYAGGGDGFVTKLNATGSSLVYSTFLGGSGSDEPLAIVVNGNGDAFVTGKTISSNFNTTPGAFQTTKGGGTYDVFVCKVNPSGNSLVYSTYLGGNSNEFSFGITVDASDNVIIVGSTSSSDFDVTSGAYQTTLAGVSDAFVTKMNVSGTALVFSTLLGGSSSDDAYAVDIDTLANIYITGATYSSNFPLVNPLQSTIGGGSDAFVSKLHPNGDVLGYSTFIGGTLSDAGFALDFDDAGYVYVAGKTNSSNFPVTPGVFQGTKESTDDIFVTKIDLSASTGIINVSSQSNAFSIFPNPNNGQFTIQCDKESVFELTDITGRVINSYKVNGRLDVSENLPAGMYFVREKETGLTQKIIIQ